MDLGLECIQQTIGICNLSVGRNYFLGREPVKRVFGLLFLDKNKIRETSARVVHDFGLRDTVDVDDEIAGALGESRSARCSRNPVWERRTKHGNTSLLMMRSDKKGHRSIEVANPDLCGAGVEIESAFLVDLGGRIGRGKGLDANTGSALEQGETRDVFCSLRCEPGDINGFDARGSGNRALRQGAALGKELTQKERNIHLALAVERSRRRTHNKVTVLIGLDPVRELRELRVSQDLAPASQVDPGLRCKVRQLDSDRHGER